jgi:hypothetical protein
MLPPFDIFKVEGSGLRWMEAAADLERAKARVKVLAASSPCEYIILNQNTGEKILIKSETKRIVFQIGYDKKRNEGESGTVTAFRSRSNLGDKQRGC